MFKKDEERDGPFYPGPIQTGSMHIAVTQAWHLWGIEKGIHDAIGHFG
jgi:hypothetical protein